MSNVSLDLSDTGTYAIASRGRHDISIIIIVPSYFAVSVVTAVYSIDEYFIVHVAIARIIISCTVSPRRMQLYAARVL